MNGFPVVVFFTLHAVAWYRISMFKACLRALRLAGGSVLTLFNLMNSAGPSSGPSR